MGGIIWIMINYIALGEKIQKVRLQHHYTQQQLALKLRFSEKHVGNIERGTAHPSLECLVGISIALNTSIEYLLSDSLPSHSCDSSKEWSITIEDFLTQQLFEIQRLQRNLESLRRG